MSPRHKKSTRGIKSPNGRNLASGGGEGHLSKNRWRGGASEQFSHLKTILPNTTDIVHSQISSLRLPSLHYILPQKFHISLTSLEHYIRLPSLHYILPQKFHISLTILQHYILPKKCIHEQPICTIVDPNHSNAKMDQKLRY